MNNQQNKYFEISFSQKHSPDLRIKWNVDAFISQNCTTGFIVQHMNIRNNISSVKSDDYWESWHIKEGILENRRTDYDDNWSPIPSYFILACEEEIAKSSDGIITYSSQVYWIPGNSTEYRKIKTWKPVNGSPAVDLPMTYTFNYDLSEFFICNRFFEWNYKEELSKIKDSDKTAIHNQ